MDNFSLFGLSEEEICKTLGLEKKYQGKQIYKWLVRGVLSFDDMTDIPKMLRQNLKDKYNSFWSTEVIDQQTDDSGNTKLAIRLYDGNIVECVLLRDAENNVTSCVSSQAGCAMGCAFCRTGTLHLKRNLSASEIIEQLMHIKRVSDSDVSHVVFMGMGEPMANFDNVVKAIDFFHNPEGLNIGYRRITVSTCGVVPGIKMLADRKIPVKLAVSLVSAQDDKRSSIMPVNRTYNLTVLRNALIYFGKFSGRRFTFEYCMIKDVNIGESDAESLARFCRGLEVIVNLIPFNPCPELSFKTPSENEIKAFTSYLEKKNVSYTIRVSKGRSVCGACGQLAGKVINS